MIVLENKHLKIAINELGAELISAVTPDGERIWQGDPAFWAGHAPLLFPICGRLKDNQYCYNHQTYHLDSHGFARNMRFNLIDQTTTNASFQLHSSEATKRNYPFDFILQVDFALAGPSVIVNYTVSNTGDQPMYFSIGAHEGYNCPGGIGNYYIQFDKKVTLDSHEVVGPILGTHTVRVAENTDRLDLLPEHFTVDALVFKNIPCTGLTLRHKNGTKIVTVDYPDFSHLLLWTTPTAPFLCIEPWTGTPDNVASTGFLEQKESITQLAPGHARSWRHTLTF